MQILKVINQSITREQQLRTCHERESTSFERWKKSSTPKQANRQNEKKKRRPTKPTNKDKDRTKSTQISTFNQKPNADTYRTRKSQGSREKKPNTKCINRICMIAEYMLRIKKIAAYYRGVMEGNTFLPAISITYSTTPPSVAIYLLHR
jgi:hypothetical protein